MIFRAIALSLALLIGFGAIIPLATHYSEAGASKTNTTKKKYKKKYKKYSKPWWRAYHNRVRQRKALNARKRMLRLRRIRLANAGKAALQNNQKIAKTAPAIQNSDLFILVEGKINKVLDGDTFNIVSRDGKSYQVRMLGVEAPEIRQNFGDRSQKSLSDLILGKEATVILRKKDSTGRYIGTVYAGGEDVNFLQIETGMARYFGQSGYEPMKGDRKSYEQAEQTAQAERKGLWARQKSNNAVAFKR